MLRTRQLSPSMGTNAAPGTERPLPIRFGEFILLFLFLALLAGRFNLGRVDDDAPDFDLRFAFVYGSALMVMLWWVQARHGHSFERVPLVGSVGFTLWSLWMVFAAGWAPEGARIPETVLDLGFLFSLVMLSWFVMSQLPAESLDRVWMWLVITGLFYFILAIISGPGDQGRYAAPGGGPNTFVRIMVAASIAALYVAIIKRRNWMLLCIPVFAVGAALSGSRGGLASAAIVMILFLVPVVRRLGIKKIILVASFISIGAVFASSWRDGYFANFVQERFIQQTLLEGYSSGRDQISGQAWGMFTQNLVGGVGLDGFYALQNSGIGTFEHPHNLILATMTEAGLIGGVFLFAALSRMVSAILGRRMPINVLFALILGLYFLGTAMFSGDYYDSRFLWFFLAMAALNMTRYKEGETSLSVPSSDRVL